MNEKRTGMITRMERVSKNEELVIVQIFEEVKEVQIHLPLEEVKKLHVGQRISMRCKENTYTFVDSLGGGQ